MEKLNIPEQSTANLPNCATTVNLASAAAEAELNLLEVMEIFSTICVTHPIRLLQILDECEAEENLPEIFRESAMSEFMSFKLSPFGKRLRQIH